MCACMYVCGVCVCMCVCLYVYVYICVHVCMYVCVYVCVMGVMKMGNTVPRGGLEPTSLAFWASVLPFHHSP